MVADLCFSSGLEEQRDFVVVVAGFVSVFE